MSIVIVGAGQAGAWVAKSAREAGYTGSITLLGDEVHLPYERPPLSKDVLRQARAALDEPGEHAGHATPHGDLKNPLPASLVLSEADYARLGIDVVTGKRVTAIDPTAQSVSCADGTCYPYQRLVLATGGRARRPSFSGAALPGIFTLRTLEDARAIAGQLHPAARVLVIGGGWIGLEVAAAARGHGAHVTLVEAAARLCARAVPPRLSAFLLTRHRREGVDIRLGTSIIAMRLDGEGRLSAVSTDGVTAGATADTAADAMAGAALGPFDAVIVGIGLEPNTALAAAAGLALDNGVLVDEQGRTSDPFIYATGDVACRPCSWNGGRLRLESWANAQNHGIAVGRAVAGEALAYDELPWFWSDQYDVNLQIAGIIAPDTTEVLRGDMESGSFSLFQLRNGIITAAISVNAPREMKHARQLIRHATPVDLDKLADRHIALNHHSMMSPALSSA